MSYDSEVLADSPLAYWKLEELTPPPPAPNVNLIDSADGFNGTLGPQPADLVQGRAGPILTDANSYGMKGPIGRIPNTGNAGFPLNMTGAQSWECWSILAGTGCEIMFNRGSDVSGCYLSYGQRSTGNFANNAYWVLPWTIGGTGVGKDLISCDLTHDVWHHIVVTYDGIDTMLMYVDSWLVAERHDAFPSPITPEPSPWRLGYISSIIFGAVFTSAGLSHCAIYPSVLSPARIIDHNIAALGTRASNPCGPTPLGLSCPTTTIGTVGELYDSTLITTGGTAPFTYEVLSGALPTGLELDTATGEISGTPTEVATFDFVIRVTDADLDTADTPGCGIVIDQGHGPIPPPEPPVSPPIETCPENQPASNPIQRVQRVLDFTQAIHRNIQLQISTVAPLTLFGYSMEWVPVSVSELTEQRNAYAASFQFAEWAHFFQAYVAYISTRDITWKIDVDGSSLDSYLLPNSNGTFVKQWVILKARKGKLFSWSFSSVAEFQIISSQSVLLAKEFKATGPYQILNCFGDQTSG